MLSWEMIKLGNVPIAKEERQEKHYLSYSDYYNRTLQFLISGTESLNRPPLVRFDWYSHKQTPVHIG